MGVVTGGELELVGVVKREAEVRVVEREPMADHIIEQVGVVTKGLMVALIIQELELATRGLELATQGLELATQELVGVVKRELGGTAEEPGTARR